MKPYPECQWLRGPVRCYEPAVALVIGDGKERGHAPQEIYACAECVERAEQCDEVRRIERFEVES